MLKVQAIYLCAQVRHLSRLEAEAWLFHNAKFFDGISIIDDGSMDCTVDILKAIIDKLAASKDYPVQKDKCFVRAMPHLGKNFYHNMTREVYPEGCHIWIGRLDTDEFIRGIRTRKELLGMMQRCLDVSRSQGIMHPLYNVFDGQRLDPFESKRRFFCNLPNIKSPGREHTEEGGFHGGLHPVGVIEGAKDTHGFWVEHRKTRKEVEQSIKYNMMRLKKVYKERGEQAARDLWWFLYTWLDKYKFVPEEFGLVRSWDDTKAQLEIK